MKTISRRLFSPFLRRFASTSKRRFPPYVTFSRQSFRGYTEKVRGNLKPKFPRALPDFLWGWKYTLELLGGGGFSVRRILTPPYSPAPSSPSSWIFSGQGYPGPLRRTQQNKLGLSPVTASQEFQGHCICDFAVGAHVEVTGRWGRFVARRLFAHPPGWPSP